MKLKDRVAIIVGGGSGIGRATAKLLAQEGAKLMVCDIVKESADSVAEEINKSGGEAVSLRMDMIKEEDCAGMAEATVEKYGRIDILCNIAGGSMGANIRDSLVPFVDQDKTMWDRIIDINLNGARNCTKAVIPYMIEKQYGKIVNTSSIAAVSGLVGATDYAAAKAGIIAFTKTLSMEVAQYGILVNTVTPSGTNSERIRVSGFLDQTAGGQPSEGQQRPVSALAEPEELAEAYLFLVSSASDHVSGQNIIFGAPAPQRPPG
jgi:NAD(P)-dependent dehydrogenase (short-subunit alcohol dehydrogenase family)